MISDPDTPPLQPPQTRNSTGVDILLTEYNDILHSSQAKLIKQPKNIWIHKTLTPNEIYDD